MLRRTVVIFKLFRAKSFTGLLVKNFQLTLRIRRVMFFAQQAEKTLAFNITGHNISDVTQMTSIFCFANHVEICKSALQSLLLHCW